MKYLGWVLIIVIVGLGIWGIASMNSGDKTNIDEDLQLETATLSPVGDYVGNGTATRSFDGQVFSHGIEAELPDPADGKFYEGWLVVPNSEGFMSTGELERGGNGEWSLTYTSDQDESIYAIVVVTEETAADGLDGKPEAHVLEGRF